ncbi:MAG: PadR family transcriptional regulator [Steroidobacterales bacterium]
MANFPSNTELLILGLLRDRPGGMYGLELVEASGGALKRGTVYVTLSRMEDKGFIKSRLPKKSDHAGLPRPHYSIAAPGQRCLEAAQVMNMPMARV